jgi:serine/threonine protein kinase/formylglycine-generating enzyme required for sulfatase activity
MDLESQRRVDDLFDRALEKQPAEVAAFLMAECPDDPAVRAEVLSLLAHQAAAAQAGFLAELACGPLAALSTDAPVAPPVPSPHTPAGYELLGELGRGGMGIVYKARQLALNRFVALKMIRSGADATPAELARFHVEAHAVARLQHPNLVQIYEVGQQDGRPFVALEYLAGGSLAQKLGEAPLPPIPAAEMVHILSRAVQYAHQQGLLHRDLKPANILLATDGTPKIADFGLAKRLEGEPGLTVPEHLTESGAVLGTPSYMAPEQASGKSKDIGPHTDVYALGAILYETLTGRPPFQGTSRTETLLQVLWQEPVSPRRLQPKVPRDLETICLKCLQKEPGKRYASAAALADDLRCFLAGEPIRARPVGLAERIWRWCRRKPLVASLAATLLFLIFAVILSAFYLQGSYLEKEQKNHAIALVGKLAAAETQEVPAIVVELGRYRRWADPALEEILQQPDSSRKERLHARIALLPTDPAPGDALLRELLQTPAQEIKPPEVQVIRAAIREYKERFTPILWQHVGDPNEPRDLRFRLACLLAELDPENPRWGQLSQGIVDHWVTENQIFLGQWLALLRPVRLVLLEPLGQYFRDKTQVLERSIATNILADYAADQVEILVNLILDADPKQYALLWPVLQRHDEDATKGMQQELAKVLLPSWKDAPLDPAWPTPGSALVRQIEAAQGMLTERFALCQTMPLDAFAAMAEGLRSCGYRPVRFRPYATDKTPQVAAVWTRDSVDWRIAQGLTKEAVYWQEKELRKQGFVPADVAGYVAADGEERYAVVWDKPIPIRKQVYLAIGVPSANPDLLFQPWKEWELTPWTWQQVLGKDGIERNNSLWWKPPRGIRWERVGGAEDQYEMVLFPDRLQADINISKGEQAEDSNWDCQRVLTQAQRKLQAQPDDVDAHWQRAWAHFWLGQDQPAIGDLSWVIKRKPTFSGAYLYRAMAYARLGKSKDAKDDLAELQKQPDGSAIEAWAAAVASSYLGLEDGLKRLEVAVAQNHSDSTFLYYAARAYSMSSKAAAKGQGGQARRYADRAVELLRQAMANGELLYSWLDHPSLNAIRQHPGFLKLLEQGPDLSQSYNGILYSNPDFESKETHGLDPTRHLARCRQLAAENCRPAALSVTWLGKERGLITASVWHRPMIPESARDMLAGRQAQALVSLFKLGQADSVWRFLQYHPDQDSDPRLRTYLIQRLSSLDISPPALCARLTAEPDVSARRALLQALGGYPDGKLSTTLRKPLITLLLQSYRKDSDVGIHSDCGWLLGKWGYQEEVRRIDHELALEKSVGDRSWYAIDQDHTLAVFHGPVEFLMGSPGQEPDRKSLQAEAEALHRRRIGRSFAVSTKKVTVEQFKRFLHDKPQVQVEPMDARSSELGAPAIRITWFQAAQYCRWLSEVEHVPVEQMCYPEVGKIRPGMRLPPDYLKRTGYRLPTEAEWEYACRSGSGTSRHYGFDNTLLGEYAWHPLNSDDRAHPVGLLRPNDFGLFDTYGNAWEWCQDRLLQYHNRWGQEIMEDSEDAAPVTEEDDRVLRGGAFDSRVADLRSAARYHTKPSDRNHYVGFRIARTLPAAFFSHPEVKAAAKGE